MVSYLVLICLVCSVFVVMYLAPPEGLVSFDDSALLSRYSEIEVKKFAKNKGIVRNLQFQDPYSPPIPTTVTGYSAGSVLPSSPACLVHQKDWEAYRGMVVLVSIIHPVTKSLKSIYCRVIGACNDPACLNEASRRGNDFLVKLERTSCRPYLDFDPGKYILHGIVQKIGKEVLTVE